MRPAQNPEEHAARQSTTATFDQRPSTSLAAPVAGALAVLAVGSAALWLWAERIVVDETIAAEGRVMPASVHHVLRHPLGGIVYEVGVAEGDIVEPGQVLLRFGAEGEWEEHNDLLRRGRAAAATLARLEAERVGRAAVSFPADLVAAADAGDAVEAETALFAQRRRDSAAKTRIIEEYRIGISGIRDAQEGMLDELALLARRMGETEDAFRAARADKPKLLTHESAKARLESEIGRLNAEVARVQQRIADAELEIIRGRENARQQLARELEGARRTAAAIDRRLQALAMSTQRRSLIALWRGLVMAMRYRRPGEHVRPEHPVLELRPLDAPITIEARLSRWDAPAVSAGAAVKIRVRTEAPVSPGTLDGAVRTDPGVDGIDVGRLIIDVTTVDLDPHEKAAIGSGMPAAVEIAARRRPIWESLLRPLGPPLARWLGST